MLVKKKNVRTKKKQHITLLSELIKNNIFRYRNAVLNLSESCATRICILLNVSNTVTAILLLDFDYRDHCHPNHRSSMISQHSTVMRDQILLKVTDHLFLNHH